MQSIEDLNLRKAIDLLKQKHKMILVECGNSATTYSESNQVTK